MNDKATQSLDEYTLFRLLCELESESACSQRELAKRLGCALGLVNSYLKTATANAWIKIREVPPNRCTYHLTAKGTSELKLLSLKHSRYLDRLIPVIVNEYQPICKLLQDDGVERVSLCGVDSISVLAWIALYQAGIEVVTVMDNKNIGTVFMGKPVVSLAHAMLGGLHRVVIGSRNRAAELQRALIDLGTEPSSITVPAVFLENRDAT